MKRLSDDLTKACQTGIICSYLLEYCGRIMKRDNDFYSGRTKNLLNQLLESNKPILKNSEALRTLQHPNLVNVRSGYGEEALSEEMDTSFELVTDFVTLYLSSDPVQLTDLWILQRSLLNGQKVFTESDVDDLLKEYVEPQLQV